MTRQNRCRNQLQKQRLANVMKQQKLETVDALQYIRDQITKLAGQGPVEYHLEAHRREYLHNAVLGKPWAFQSLTSAVDENWTFQELSALLDGAFLHYEISEEAAKKESGFQRQQNNSSRESFNFGGRDQNGGGTFFEGQGTYGRPRKPGSRSSARGPK